VSGVPRTPRGLVARAGRGLVCCAVAALAALAAVAPAGAAVKPTSGSASGAASPTPVLAYYYLWFDKSSWDRAKIDVPTLGRYTSDDPAVMREHVRLAKSAGIDGFVVGWKNTPTNNRRLKLLMGVAREEDFSLAMIYQGLDFDRKPLAATRVADDYAFFRDAFAQDPVFLRLGGKPLTIWSGTWSFSHADVSKVTTPVRDKLLVLSTEKQVDDYQRVSDVTDGDAYYWSSVNPDTNGGYQSKLVAMGQAVHSHGQFWVAPFAPGFDARQVGGDKAVDRFGGKTLREEYAAAVKSSPDVLGLISWNEFSENSYVEPSENFGQQSLNVLRDLRGAQPAVPQEAVDSSDSGTGAFSGLPSSFWPNVLMLGGFLAVLLVGGALVGMVARRRPRRGHGRRRADDEDLPPLKAEDVRVKW
jgi:Glycosyl hydrolase family 99